MKDEILAVQRMQDYIKEHLTEDITMKDLAQAASYSPWYARRLFLNWTHLTPSQYIRRLRLRESALKLRDEKCRVIDVAMSLGFGSVDSYQRAFCREFGCNPKEYSLHPTPLYLFTPFSVISQNTERRSTMENVRSIFIQLTTRPQRKVLIKRGIKAEEYFTYCEEVGCDIWGLLTSIPSITGEPVCLWLPKHLIKPGTSKYVQGVEVAMNYDGAIPDGFDVIELPKSEYLMFQSEPFPEEEYESYIDQIQTAAAKYDPSVIGYQWDRDNPVIQLEPIGTRGYIELYPVKPLQK